MITWKLEKRKVSELKEYEANPRVMTEKGIKDLTESIEKFGMAEPLVINTDNTLIGGHARLIVLKLKETETVDCYVPNKKLTDKQVKEFCVRLNRNIAGKWDFDILANMFETPELLEWGFESWELMGGPNVDKINEKENWEDMPEFEQAEKEFKVILYFKNEEQRESYCNDNNITITHKMNNQWVSRTD